MQPVYSIQAYQKVNYVQLLRLHYMIGAFDTKSIHYSVSFYGTSLKFGRNIA